MQEIALSAYKASPLFDSGLALQVAENFHVFIYDKGRKPFLVVQGESLHLILLSANRSQTRPSSRQMMLSCLLVMGEDCWG